MQNCRVYALEDSYEYSEVDSIEYENEKYLLLSQVDNPTNICIRKLVSSNGISYFYRLDNIEFTNVFNNFLLKNKNLFE